MVDTAYLQRLVEADLGVAEDNLYRAELAARGGDPNAPWGQSGQTLASLMAGYQTAVDKAKRQLKALQEL